MVVRRYPTARRAAQNWHLFEGKKCRTLVGQHHWLIDSPKGPASRGICRACGEERDFQNYLEETFGNVYLGRPAGSFDLASEIEPIRRFIGENKDEETNEGA